VNQASFKPDFELLISDDGATISVRGELDSGTCEQLLDAFHAAARHEEITLDLSGVSFIDSAGTRTVILIGRSAAETGISLRVIPPGEEVTELLRTAGLIERLELRPQTAELGDFRASFVERVDLELPRDPQSPARARAEVREALHGRDQTQLADVTLLTSEVVTNAVVHPRGAGQTPVSLRILNYGDAIRVEVEDAGEGFDPSAPRRPAGDRGRGLFLVDRFASRWGAEHVEANGGPRFRVWFELDADAQRDERAATG
jgi:anti-anti-sigma factor